MAHNDPTDEAAALNRHADRIMGATDAPHPIDADLDPGLASTVWRLHALSRTPAPAGARGSGTA